jgi:hypothetical protein
MRIVRRVVVPAVLAALGIGLIAQPAQAFQLVYFDTYPTMTGCLNTGESGLDSGSWYGYQCRRTGPTTVQLWVSFTP